MLDKQNEAYLNYIRELLEERFTGSITINVFKGKIVHKAYLGNFLFFFISVNETMIRVQAPHDLPQEEGQELYLLLDPQKCVVLS